MDGRGVGGVRLCELDPSSKLGLIFKSSPSVLDVRTALAFLEIIYLELLGRIMLASDYAGYVEHSLHLTRRSTDGR